jgi:hypothetical protein
MELILDLNHYMSLGPLGASGIHFSQSALHVPGAAMIPPQFAFADSSGSEPLPRPRPQARAAKTSSQTSAPPPSPSHRPLPSGSQPSDKIKKINKQLKTARPPSPGVSWGSATVPLSTGCSGAHHPRNWCLAAEELLSSDSSLEACL